MAEIRPVRPVKPLCCVLASDDAGFDAARHALAETFGPIEMESERFAFTATEFYAAEMGEGLFRVLFAFRELADPACLPRMKVRTNELEHSLVEKLASGAGRPVNLDPGYLTVAKFVLASTKDYTHRVYLGDGVYAEVTLTFCKSGIRSFAWTYPDFASGLYTAFLMNVRSRLQEQLAGATTI